MLLCEVRRSVHDIARDRVTSGALCRERTTISGSGCSNGRAHVPEHEAPL